MNYENFVVRKASSSESDAVAEVARRSRKHFLPYLPDLHTLEEDKAFFRSVVFVDNEVWLAEVENNIVGFCAFKEGWLDHLYFLPSHVGKKTRFKAIDGSKGHLPTLTVMDISKKCPCHQLL